MNTHDDFDETLADPSDPFGQMVHRARAEAEGFDATFIAARWARQLAPPSVGFIARLRTRVAAVAASVIVSLGGFTGVAVAAQSAAPGDFLYGMDRALESVGIGRGGTPERLDEAATLVRGGETQAGLEHAAAAIGDAPMAQAALFEIAARFDGIEEGDAVRSEVIGLLQFVAESPDVVDGREVARRAATIGGPPDSTPGADGPPGDTPAGDTPAGTAPAGNPPGAVGDRDPSPDGEDASPAPGGAPQGVPAGSGEGSDDGPPEWAPTPGTPPPSAP